MAEVDIGKELENIAQNKTGEGEAIETVLATYAFDEDGVRRWLFRSWNTTPMFDLALGENWHYRVYAEPYRPLWDEALRNLEKRPSSSPVLIDLDVKYEWVEDTRIAVHLRETTLREFDSDIEF